VQQLRAKLQELDSQLRLADCSSPDVHAKWLTRACVLGQEYVDLEKYVNLNYTGLQKILKKHDKLLPDAQCRPFYQVGGSCVCVCVCVYSCSCSCVCWCSCLFV
jgi:SPX domain protein involved in polyphosphate accumulation